MAEDTVDVRIVPDPVAPPTAGVRQPNGRLTLIIGAARDARAVALQVGDIFVHMTPAEARAAAEALVRMAQVVDLLLVDPTRRLAEPRHG